MRWTAILMLVALSGCSSCPQNHRQEELVRRCTNAGTVNDAEVQATMENRPYVPQKNEIVIWLFRKLHLPE